MGEFGTGKRLQVFFTFYMYMYVQKHTVIIMEEMAEKTVTLNRDVDSDGRLKSFGFSVLGGNGMKYPAVVCEVDPGGPADAANVSVCVCVLGGGE